MKFSTNKLYYYIIVGILATFLRHIDMKTTTDDDNTTPSELNNGFIDVYNPNVEVKDNEIVIALDLPFDNLCRSNDSNVCQKRREYRPLNPYHHGKYYASAAAIAVEEINNRTDLLPNHKLRYVWKTGETDTDCDQAKAIRVMLKQLRMPIHAFLGFACHCRSVASIASATNLPLFSMSCQEMDLSKKTEYPTFARTTTLNQDVIYMIITLLKRYKWKRFAIMFEKTHIWDSVYKALKKEVDEDNSYGFDILLAESYRKRDTYHLGYDSLAHVFHPFLENVKKKARIVLLLLDKGKLQQFMLIAAHKNMTNGDYVFIAVHPFATSETLLRYSAYLADYLWILPWMLPGLKNNGNSFFFGTVEEMVKAYQSLFVLMPQIPAIKDKHNEKFEEFQDRVRVGMGNAPFYSTVYEGKLEYSAKSKRTTKPPPEAHQLYDAVMLYALGLNKTISKGYSFTNGTDVIQNILNTRHRSISGSPFVVNCKADVQVLFEVGQFQFDPDVKAKFKSLQGKKDRKMDGLFKPKRVLIFESRSDGQYLNCSNADKAEQNRFYIKPVDYPVKWLTGKIISDTPACGFNNENCPESAISKGTILGLAISLTMLGVIICVIPVFLYRNYHLKKELNLQLWKISESELFYHDWSVSTSSLGSLTSQIGSLHYDMPTKQQFISTAYYKGQLVAVKNVNKKTVELNRNVLMELKMVRDVRNENLNMFIGACIEPGKVLLITAYASRGSLQDVLENNDIQLDAPFILSLVYDIIKGMLYLHSTEIKSHGNLKSSNCVIDSRWVLKISDFGLNTFRSRQGSVSSLESEPLNSLLWKAPELLRIDIPPTHRGTQKGDVYSFGIILQECHTRDGAWGSYQGGPELIIEKVKMRLSPPYRPVVSDFIDGAEGLRDVMKKCWKENPEERPYFSELRKDVEVMMKANGMRANLVENMILMLEKYSKSLEEIVQDRTVSLREEKHKVESLLERMLPKSVANQLMQGLEVEAELFEEVTIYFSDIVGFTSICSSISPMEVVTLLNTLYTMFDNIAHDYDVYKVETIGDAYMVVSGLPIRNKKQHAREISLMSLDILEHMKTFKIRPNQKQINIRIGIHSGPVVAGVVGTTMPRYCLFGDTVNVAARMESTGEALRIQMSEKTRETLTTSSADEFIIEPRGVTDIKGKGNLHTYWLQGMESRLLRKRTITRRDQATLYERDKNSPSFTRILRESPKGPRHKLHVTPTTTEIMARTPPMKKEQRAKNYLRPDFSNILPICKKSRTPKNTHVEITDCNTSEKQNLIIPRTTAFGSPSVEYHKHLENGNSLQDSPRPV